MVLYHLGALVNAFEAWQDEYEQQKEHKERLVCVSLFVLCVCSYIICGRYFVLTNKHKHREREGGREGGRGRGWEGGREGGRVRERQGEGG